MEVRLYPEATKVVANAIYITGATRTGTTMMEQLISSLEGVECVDEPPMLRICLTMIHELPEDIFRLLFEGYLFEEHMMYTIPGRKINVNRNDQTSIYNSKSEDEVAKRLARSYRRLDIFPIAIRRQCALKQVEVGQYLKTLIKYYPELRTIVMIRRPESVICSMLEKHWFSDDQLYGNSGKWLFRKDSTLNFPDWLHDDEFDDFLKMSEAERCCRYYLFEYENLLDTRNELACTPGLIIDYDSLVNSPRRIFSKITKQLGCKFGDITSNLLEGISEPRKERVIPVDEVRPELIARVHHVYEQCKEMETVY